MKLIIWQNSHIIFHGNILLSTANLLSKSLSPSCNKMPRKSLSTSRCLDFGFDFDHKNKNKLLHGGLPELKPPKNKIKNVSIN